MSDLKTRWESFGAQPFPQGCRGKSVHDIDLTTLQANAIACIVAAIETEGRIATRMSLLMESTQKDFQTVIPDLSAEARSYFEKLGRLLDEAVQSV